MNLEDRIKRRLLMEGGPYEPGADGSMGETTGLSLLDGRNHGIYTRDELWIEYEDAARIAALEAEDSANPIAQTEQVRPPLRLNIDIAAFQAVYDDLDHE